MSVTPESSNSMLNNIAKVESYVVNELIESEKRYVRELREVIEHYIEPFEAVKNLSLIPLALRGQSDLLFGNIRELYELHCCIVFEFKLSSGSIAKLCRTITIRKNQFLSLYWVYYQNKSPSEALQIAHVRGNKFFLECQKRAGHQLPLNSYLSTPNKRITRYEQIFQRLHKNVDEKIRPDVETALASIKHLLSQLETAVDPHNILNFKGDIRFLGLLRLQIECDVYAFKTNTHRLNNKAQRRHMFLYDSGVLFCKKRIQTKSGASEQYENKLCVPLASLGFAECSNSELYKFEIWDNLKPDGVAVQPLYENESARVLQYLGNLTKARMAPLSDTVDASRRFSNKISPAEVPENQSAWSAVTKIHITP